MRTNSIFSFLFCFLFAGALCAQKPLLKVTQINFGFAFEEEMLRGLSGEYLSGLSRMDLESVFAIDEFGESDLHSFQCENPQMRLGVTMESAALPKFEIRAGLTFIKDRIDATDYWNVTNGIRNLNLNNRADEIGVFVGLNRVFRFARVMKFTAGLGANMGYSYNGRLEVWGNDLTILQPEQASNGAEVIGDQMVFYEGNSYPNQNFGYRSKNATHLRGLAQLGLSVEIARRIEFGLQYRRGFGLRGISNQPLKGSIMNSMQLQLGYFLKRKSGSSI